MSSVTEESPAIEARSNRWQRAAVLALIAVLIGLLAAEIAIAYAADRRVGDLWIDYIFYRDVGVGWLRTARITSRDRCPVSSMTSR